MWHDDDDVVMDGWRYREMNWAGELELCFCKLIIIGGFCFFVPKTRVMNFMRYEKLKGGNFTK